MPWDTVPRGWSLGGQNPNLRTGVIHGGTSLAEVPLTGLSLRHRGVFNTGQVAGRKDIRFVPPTLEVTPEQAASVDKIAKFVVRFSMTVPAILTLESMRPLSYVGSQLMHILTPAIGVFLSTSEWEAMSVLLADRRGVLYVIERIEAMDKEARG